MFELLMSFFSHFTDRIVLSRQLRREHQKNLDDPRYRKIYEQKLRESIRAKKADFQMFLLIVGCPVGVVIGVILLLLQGNAAAVLMIALCVIIFVANLRLFYRLKRDAIELTQVDIRELNNKDYQQKLDKAKEEKAAEAAAKALRDYQKAVEKKQAKKARKAAEQTAKTDATTSQTQSTSAPPPASGNLTVRGFRRPPNF